MDGYQKRTLKNGLRVVCERIPHVRSVSLGVWLGVGSRNEQTHNNGISHFIEHMLFKGTTQRSAKQIADELESVGGQLNAFTAKEYTCYYARMLDEHLDIGINLLADILFNSLFEEKEIEKEKKVILEEIKMYEDSPDEMVHDLFAQTMWQNHALGRPILGTVEAVQNNNRDSLLAYLSEMYLPEKTVISAVGNLDEDLFIQKIEAAFEHWQHSTKRDNGSEEPPMSHPCSAYNKYRDTEQVQICLGFPGISQYHREKYSMHILNNILGGGTSSRLFQEIRERQGLAYSVYSYHSAYRDSGLFCIYAATSPDNVQVVLDSIVDQVNNVCENPTPEEEIEKNKNQLRGNLLLSLESISTRMSRLGKSEVCLGRIVSENEMIAAMREVTGEGIAQLARDIFVPSRQVLVTVGPGSDQIKLKW